MRITIPGPKTEPFIDSTRARTVSLDDMTIDMAKVLGGDGNHSRGIRAAVRFAYDAYQANRFIPQGRTIGAPVAPETPFEPEALAAGPAAQPAPDAPLAPPDALP